MQLLKSSNTEIRLSSESENICKFLSDDFVIYEQNNHCDKNKSIMNGFLAVLVI